MSGIAGSIRFDIGPAEVPLVREMAQSLCHRGPDGITHWSSDSAALAQMMLRTMEDGEAVNKLMQSGDGDLILVMDGRVDNWEDLSARLADSGVRLRTRTDAELVLAAYRLWGAECPCHIEGDFAFVLWDSRARRAFCARDPLGQKPFFYHWDGRRFVFASELRPVLDALEVHPRLNEGVVAEMLDNTWISREETLWCNILRLAPGHSMTIDANGPATGRYWYPEAVPLLRYKSDAEYIEHYRETLTDVVRRLSRSHATVGYDVSGGLDSSSVFATASDLMNAGRLPAPAIKGFTMLFDVRTGAYELDYAHAVGKHTGRTITEVAPTLAPLAFYRTETLQRGVISNLPNARMHEGTYRALHACGGRVYLNGVGGDQFLAFGENALAEAIGLRDWRCMQGVLGADLKDFGVVATGWSLIRHGAYPLLPETMRAFVRRVSPVMPEGQETGTWLSRRMQAILSERRAQAAAEWCHKTNGVRIGLRERLMAVDSAYLQFGTEVLECMAQRAGVEIRSPFLNRKLVEFCLSLPLAQLRRGGTDRFVHRAAMAGVLPETVRLRADKAEFSAATAPVRDELVALRPPQKTSWIADGHFERVQACALDPDQSSYSWPEGILLCLYLLNALAALSWPHDDSAEHQATG